MRSRRPQSRKQALVGVIGVSLGALALVAWYAMGKGQSFAAFISRPGTWLALALILTFLWIGLRDALSRP